MDHNHHAVHANSSAATTWWQGLLEYFSQADFMPHGHCYLWKPALVSTHVISDFLIGSAYVLISLTLYGLVKKIKLPFSAVVLSFGLFIGACGATHYMEIWNLWNADYWWGSWIKVLTAIASVTTCIYLIRLRGPIIAFANAAKETEVHRLELIRVNEELKLQKETLEAINHELESFSYSVTHDLRAPLRGIDGFSLALIEDYSEKLNEEGKQYLKFIREGTQKMGSVIDDLLNLARITKTELKIERINLSLMANDIVENLRRTNVPRDIKFLIQDELFDYGDPGLIKIALENLISNAWKFTSKKQNASIEFGNKMENNINVYYVKDNGAGFDMAHTSRLFGAFQRLHTADEFVGTGVGLATVKRIIQRHEGKIWAEAISNEGATFFFTLGKKDHV